MVLYRIYNNFFNFAIPLLDKPSHSEVQMINDKIQPFFTRTTKDELGVPPINPDKIIDVAASFEEQKLFEHVIKLNKMSFAYNETHRGTSRDDYFTPYIMPVVPHILGPRWSGHRYRHVS